jgi:HD-GYP domain-containing protein (c-di-GMP phosphodiesterase class II)
MHSFAEKVRLFMIFLLLIKRQTQGIVLKSLEENEKPRQKDLKKYRHLISHMAASMSKAPGAEEMESLNWVNLAALARAIDAQSHWTAGHSERVTSVAIQIGRQMDLCTEELGDLYRGGLLHDVGKIGIPIEILDKPAKLTRDELEIIMGHCRMGELILKTMKIFNRVIAMVVQHHERYDGAGYPEGLNGEKIGLGARILSVADVYDALISDRPYRAGLEHHQVFEIIEHESGNKFDPRVVAAFLGVFREKPYTFRKNKVLEPFPFAPKTSTECHFSLD